MHPNPTYRKTPVETSLAFARDRSFGILMINGPEGPLASHVPFVLSEDGRTAELHLVRSNPILRSLAAPVTALLAVSGPDGYVSPDWYGTPDQVPTWNYVAVHLRGTLSAQPSDTLRAQLDRLSAQLENRLLPKPPWRIEKVSDDVLARLLRMIAPCRLDILNVDSTWKLNQNKSAASRCGAADGVCSAGIGSETAALAALMRLAKA
ncbi:Protease synthase and sporulation protein PAI 2 [Defluviimonas aquaemixtae]|uniref:Protease synthase and sporulation protein PAI 2 n=1 Tax=Albidovulum aquaemixtae TaxID=1542388 RepID=A0A2R8BKA1_9RHOB|nr:FMN-binding negative transcriptional regulator [Defluviimonas aquaemixtae]SPH23720.1 Protease synthase and sporulation protein PAI 2 [Defluviimonas aquaemixtae]